MDLFFDTSVLVAESALNHPHYAQAKPSLSRVVAGQNILPHFDVVPIGKKDYLEALSVVTSGGWSGAKIYDALLLRCAERCGAERIPRLNLSDLRQLATQLEKICSPWLI